MTSHPHKKRGRGRPPLGRQAHTRVVSLKLSEDEYSKIRRAAKPPATVSSWLRDHALAALGIVLLVTLLGCAAEPAPASAPVDHVPCDLQPGSWCEAVHLRALSSCSRVQACHPDAFTDSCVEELVAEDCATNDCAAPYTRLDELESCLWDFDHYACVVIVPPDVCAL
jgi:hypothetical protein